MSVRFSLSTQRDEYAPGALISGKLVLKVFQPTKVVSMRVVLRGSSTAKIIKQVDWNRNILVEDHHFLELEQWILPKSENGHRYLLQKGFDEFDLLFSLPHRNGCLSGKHESAADDQRTLVEPEIGEQYMEMDYAGDTDDDRSSIVMPLRPNAGPTRSSHLGNNHTTVELPGSFSYMEHRVGHIFQIEYNMIVIVETANGVKPYEEKFPLIIHPSPIFVDKQVRLCTDLLQFGHGLMKRSEPTPFHIIAEVPWMILHLSTTGIVKVFIVFTKEMSSLEGVMLKDLTIKLKTELHMRANDTTTLQMRKTILFQKTIPLDGVKLEQIVQGDQVFRSLCGEKLEISCQLKRVPVEEQDFKICNGLQRHTLSVKGRLGFSKTLKQGFKLHSPVQIV